MFTQPDPSPVPVAAHAFSCPFVASGSWRSGYVPRVSWMTIRGALLKIECNHLCSSQPIQAYEDCPEVIRFSCPVALLIS